MVHAAAIDDLYRSQVFQDTFDRIMMITTLPEAQLITINIHPDSHNVRDARSYGRLPTASWSDTLVGAVYISSHALFGVLAEL